MNLFQELRRRNVFRVAAAYGVMTWLVLQVVDVVAPLLELPGWLPRAVLLVLLAGFPVALVIAWAFELTPQGLKREAEVQDSRTISARTGRRLDRLIIVGLVLVIVLLVVERTMFATRDAAGPADARPSVAVLPFANLSSDPEQEYFADGLTEEILNALAQLPELLVTARTSSFYFKEKDVPIDEIAQRLGVANVLEGSVRRSGDSVRITAQLIRASDGFHLWSQTYDATMENVFEVQDDIARKVVSALDILLDEEKRELMEQAGVRNPEAYAQFARGFELHRLGHSELPQIPTLARARTHFERATELAPELWAAYFISADLQSHIMLTRATGTAVDGIDPALVEGAQEEHSRLLRLAARSAPNQAAQDYVDLTRRLFADNWTGLGTLAQGVFDHTQACGFAQWTHLLGANFGNAMPAHEFYLRYGRCNAVDESNWVHAAFAAIYADRPELALAAVEEGLSRAETTEFLLEARVTALVARGSFGEARQRAAILAPGNFHRNKAEALIAGALGDAEELERLRAVVRESTAERAVFDPLQLAAWAGDREAANAFAAEMDARPSGPTALLIGTHFCFCGAPFDIEKTPNFEARFRQTDLAWPPAGPIAFPLKDW